ncbi:MAG TPA: phosphate ABC transporter permease PstA [Polyangiaceae bacterium]|nr:phosphate ABC transporter permease PstA [Polyangiaceae bacterium]
MAQLATNSPGLPAGNRSFRRSLSEPRTLVNTGLTVLAIALSVFAMFPLFSVLYMLLVKGAASLRLSLFTELTPGAGMEGGGIGNAILGTFVVVLVSTGIALPLGFMGAVYLAEYGDESKLATVVRFCGKVLTGLPSILAGVFAYAMVVVTTGSFSALAGGAAMAVLMVPTVMLTSESALRAVPSKMKMAAFGMGATRAQVVLRIVIPTAIPGMLTGVMLALSRALGETAPLLFTGLFSDYWFEGKLLEPIASLSVLIYNFAGSPFEQQVSLAWAASLVLVTIVLVLNVIAQVATRRPEEH